MNDIKNMEEMSTVRTIKKYPNRRLYDTQESSYVTLEDVRQLVLGKQPFKVVDSRSRDDITRSILLQIISEQESHEGAPMFTNNMLQQLIRFYGNSLQGLMGEYLEKSITIFLEQQGALKKQMQSVMDANPFTIMSKIAEKNLSMWKSLGSDTRNENGKEE